MYTRARSTRTGVSSARRERLPHRDRCLGRPLAPDVQAMPLRAGELDLDGDNPPIGALDDEIDLVSAILVAVMQDRQGAPGHWATLRSTRIPRYISHAL